MAQPTFAPLATIALSRQEHGALSGLGFDATKTFGQPTLNAQLGLSCGAKADEHFTSWPSFSLVTKKGSPIVSIL